MDNSTRRGESMKKLLSILAVTTTAAAVVAGVFIAKKLEEQKEEEVKLIEIKNNEEDGEEPEQELACEPEVEEVEDVQAPVAEPTESEEEVEEPVQEETVEEPCEDAIPTVEEQTQENKYPSISERKMNAIKKQIGVMLEAMPEETEVKLQHYVVFPTKEAADNFYDYVKNDGYVLEVENEDTEISLTKDYHLDAEYLETEILTLAEVASEYEGVYKGWAVKVN